MTDSLVSVVTVNWNNRQFIETCLEHLRAQSYPSVEIIVVDNGSTDGSDELLRERYAGCITLIRLETNTGFTGGMNRGIAASHGDYVVILNSDAFLHPDFIARAVQAFETPGNERVGVVGGKLFYYADGQKTATIDHVGFFLKLRMAVCNSRNTDLPELVFGPSGTCPVLRRSLLDEVAFAPGEWFDRYYFAYYEDVDLWFRAQLLGWKVLFLPEAIGWHVHSGSVGGRQRLYERAPFLQVHALKNRYMTILKDYPAGLLLLMGPFLLATELAVLLFFAVRMRNNLRNVLAAQRYIVCNLPAILRRRRFIQRQRRVGAFYLVRYFKQI